MQWFIVLESTHFGMLVGGTCICKPFASHGGLWKGEEKVLDRWICGFFLPLVHYFIGFKRKIERCSCTQKLHLNWDANILICLHLSKIWTRITGTYWYRTWRRGLLLPESSSSHRRSAATPHGVRSCEAGTLNTPCCRSQICRILPGMLQTKEHPRQFHEYHAAAEHRQLHNGFILPLVTCYNAGREWQKASI